MSISRNGYPWRLLRPAEAVVTEDGKLAFNTHDMSRAKATGIWIGSYFFGIVRFIKEPETEVHKLKEELEEWDSGTCVATLNNHTTRKEARLARWCR